MQRRDFLKKAGLAAAATTAVSAPAIAADAPKVSWRLASSFPKSLDTIYGAAEMFSKRVAGLTGGNFQIRVFAGGEIVPGLQVFDAVSNGTVECGHTASYYYVGKNKVFGFDTALPFGLDARQQLAWMLYGNGMKLMREVYREHNIVNFIGGNTGTQMGGWFRKPIKDLNSVKGLKMRIPGLGGEVWKKLGAVPQAIPGGEIYPALERGAIDAAEWVGPYDDEKLGFYKVAKNYYYPGWWEGGPMLSFYVQAKAWEALPKEYKEAVEVAAAESCIHMQAEYDAKNPLAIERLKKLGVKVQPFPEPFMKAAYKAAFEIYDEEARKNPTFAKVYQDWTQFRKTSNAWMSLAEQSFSSFVAKQK